MSEIKKLRDSGQSIWLDNIRRAILLDGTLARYVRDLGVTGVTSNPTIFEKAIRGSADYDTSLWRQAQRGATPEQAFFEIALEDLRAAADVLRPVYDESGGEDGFVSLEVAPTLAWDAQATIAQALDLHARAARPNLLIKVPGTAPGAVAIEELIAAGVPVNVTLLFSTAHCQTAAEAWLRGLERRLAAGQGLRVPSVASLFVSRWDGKTAARLPAELANRVGIAVAMQSFAAFRRLLGSQRWRRLAERGARPQRLLWASTGVKDPALPQGYYVSALAAAGTVNTLPEATLLDFAERGRVGRLLGVDAAGAERVLADVRAHGIDLEGLAAELQVEGAQAFTDSWHELLAGIGQRLRELRGR
jgi:transaldolase